MPLWPIGVHLLVALLLTGGLLLVSHLLGERHREPETGLPYEGGAPSTGTARGPFAAHYYLIAMFFVIFDLEAVFLFAWAVAAREAGWLGFVEILIFAAVLLAALAWLWRVGALDWAPAARRAAARAGRPVGRREAIER